MFAVIECVRCGHTYTIRENERLPVQCECNNRQEWELIEVKEVQE